MKKLLRFLKGYRKEAVLAPLFKLLEAIFELLVPLCVASLIDIGIGTDNRSYVVKMVLLMVALGTTGLLVSVTAQWFSAKAATGFAKKMKSELFAHIETLSPQDRGKLGSSTLVTRLTSDSNQVQGGINMFLRLFLRSPFVVIGAAVMAFTVDATLSWIFVVIIPLLSLVVYLIMRRTVPMYKVVQSKVDGLMVKTRENLSGVRVLRAYGKESSEKSEFSDSTDALKHEQLRAGNFSSLLNPLTSVVINLAIVVLIYFGKTRFDLNLIEVGALVALVNYMNQILVELVKFANLIITLTRAIASGNRIQSVFDTKPSIANVDDVSNGDLSSDIAVEFNHLYLTYMEGGNPALSDITFKVRKGEKIGIIGATGSGKSSLVNMIPRFYEATKGSVSVFSSDVRLWNLDCLRSIIGIVPQKARLFKGTIRDNIKWGNPDASDDEIIEALKLAEAYDFVLEKEGGLDYKIKQGGRNVSGGQRQRLTIARAMVRKPSILILDDSASALDYATDARLRSTIASLSGMTVFVVSQRTSSLLSMDRIIVLSGGRIAGIGSHKELLAANELYREIYNSQFGDRGDSNG